MIVRSKTKIRPFVTIHNLGSGYFIECEGEAEGSVCDVAEQEHATDIHGHINQVDRFRFYCHCIKCEAMVLVYW